MSLSKFFIDRPIFAGVISTVILLAGLISMVLLPISEYPEVVPPSVIVKAQFPGANPKVIAQTVATPLEEQINGVEDMLYMSSQAASDGTMTLTISFKLGTDPDLATQLVQNRVNQALTRLPEVTRQLGVTTVKSSPDLTMVVHLTSPNERYDMLYLRNYALLNVKDQLAKIQGIGSVQLFGSGDYAMRIWLDPQKVAERGMTATEVIAAIRRQNVQVAAGVIGGPPYGTGVAVQVPINAQGRLTDADEFREIIIKRDGGVVTRLKDVARIDLDAAQYGLRSLLDNKPAVAIPVFQAPGSNAIEISNQVRATMAELKKSFPEGLDYAIAYDPTVFVRGSIEAVVHTLLEAVALVVIVVILFLQTWRASIIPLLAVPISIIGTFAVMHLFGFSINALSLFGLVLAIGIVVDDAIVVVENVERNIENGLSPREATLKAMREVTGPIIAIALVLCAVFVPIAFISGLTGQFYRQFALTIAFSTVISAFNSLTLSPALAVTLLRGEGAPKDALTRGMDRVLGPFFRGFNRVFHASSHGYGRGVGGILGHKSLAMLVYVGLLGATYLGFAQVPPGFVPSQDKQYLVGFAQLPEGATLDRTESVIRAMSDIALRDPGVESAIAFPGLSINGFINSPSAGVVFVTLKPFEQRETAELSGFAISQRLQQRYAGVSEAFIAIFPPPPVQGLGTIGGFKLQVEDRTDQGYEALDQTMKAVMAKAATTPELAGVFSSYKIGTPELYADLDRTKAAQLGVDVQEVFDTMQIYLGSLYVNDFNKFGRTYQVIAQADGAFRSKPDDILRLQTRNFDGRMVPLGAVVTLSDTSGPDSAMRYNAFRSADLNGGPAPGYSTGQAQGAMTKLLAETLPKGMDFEWTELTYQQILAGNTTMMVFPLCVLLVFLVLAAQYESLFLPLAIILIVPLCLLSAITGVWLTGGDNNMFTQIGLFVLIGLACKNAILIVEFARELEIEGQDTVPAAIEAARLRLRPILMTSIAFIMGVVPLVISSGAGAEMRHAMGIAVFSGMLGVTVFGLFLTPVFYVLMRSLEKRVTGTQKVHHHV
ncbi:multidrug efflux RND transporter permease subunit [Rhodospirillum rubrum]|uniref:efflux RND transporter permease subunit n=1 Tax=Rhodospirillum rubrum TaxID=1085 RepID=UPI001905E57F|nr:efflux RND transporter permease subunit [Rhodospirillum rubrum]MBK1664968.1 multidrug efflux RND transporter permease subunit [Rhodospirillum rubrum]MBK1676914.1 multidrug efflux RND transporter permease subunit [Rhodospirillum rubrum]